MEKECEWYEKVVQPTDYKPIIYNCIDVLDWPFSKYDVLDPFCGVNNKLSNIQNITIQSNMFP